jgi:hypothetical protein
MLVVQAEEFKQPRKVLQVGEQLVDKDTVSDSPPTFRTGLRDLHPWP